MGGVWRDCVRCRHTVTSKEGTQPIMKLASGRTWTRAWIGLLCIGFSGVWRPLYAEEPAEEPKPVDELKIEQSSATIERIMAQAVRNIARRYNLNEEQTAKTETLMTREVYRFLKDHEDKVWPAIRDLLACQLGGNPPEDRAEIQRIGRAAGPLAKLAQDAILRANEEWRLSLTPEQKRMHDFDLAEMRKTFEGIDRNFEAWEKGEPAAGGIFPPPDPKLAERSPPLPPRPKKGVLQDPITLTFDLNIFDTYVEQFIQDYDLDEGQITSARSIRNEFKDKAADFMSANREDFGKILQAQEQALRGRDRESLSRAELLRKQLLKPVYAFFSQMGERLKGLLNSAQLERYAANHPGEDGDAVGEPEEVEKPQPSTTKSDDKTAAAAPSEPAPPKPAEQPKQGSN